MPVLHGQECGLRGRLAGKRGPCPLLSITPAGDVRGCPRPQTNFIHILWKNLICDNVAAISFLRLTREAGVLAMQGLRLLFA